MHRKLGKRCLRCAITGPANHLPANNAKRLFATPEERLNRERLQVQLHALHLALASIARAGHPYRLCGQLHYRRQAGRQPRFF
jgi:hypothetical protein